MTSRTADTSVTGPTAAVTGAGSGLGRSISLTLLAAGYRVALLGRRPAPLEETATAGSANHPPLVVPTDVTDEQQVADAFARVAQAWGRLDLLVNNAGAFGPSGDIDEIEPAQWRETVDVNLTGAFLCAREAVRLMKRQAPQGGRIVNVGSVSAHAPRPRSAAYTASKHALTGLTRSLSLDGRSWSIACGQIDVGNAATEMTAGIAAGARQADGSVRPEPTFDPVHVGEAVLQMARLPVSVNVQFMTIMATSMPYVGRG